MKKIFKYKLLEEGDFGTWHVDLPCEHKLLRIDFVDDCQYKGWYVWAIVDTDNLAGVFRKFVNPETKYTLAEFNSAAGLIPHEMRVKEKQGVTLLSPPVYAEEQDGKLFIYTEEKVGVRQKYIIHFYKTGQQLPDNINDFEYIGLNRLWIVAELGLYTFVEKL